jgi:hypothetical protein
MSPPRPLRSWPQKSIAGRQVRETLTDINTYVDGSAKDPTGRVGFRASKLKPDLLAYPRSPAVHQQGGVLIDENCAPS